MAFVDYQKKGNIAVITINRLDRLNALGHDVTEGIKESCRKYEDDEEARVAILTGTGRTFSAGADIKEFGKPMIIVEAYNAIEAVKKPVIAAVNGFALGAGCYLAIVCDLRIAARSATFGMPEITRVIPVGPKRLLMQGISACVAIEMLLTGEHITAQRAYEVGLVNKVVPDEELMLTTMKMAERISEFSPWATRLVKEAFINALDLEQEELEAIQERRILARKSEDFQEAVKAFNEKRKPIFKGK